MNKKNLIIAASFFVGVLSVGSILHLSNRTTSSRIGSDDAFLALIKNDRAGFEAWVKNGGDLSAFLPLIDGKKMTVAEGLAYFERVEFIKYLQANKIKFLNQAKDGNDDIMVFAVLKNNPELFSLLLKENPDMSGTYGKNGYSLLHLAASNCSSKLNVLLHTDNKLTYDLRAKDGSIPMNLAVSSDCLPMLSYWKEKQADFKKKDGRGMNAMSILRTKKDSAMLAFLQSFETARAGSSRTSASIEPEINFYKKRIVPKDQQVDYSALIEPEDRPLDATETAEQSEFAD